MRISKRIIIIAAVIVVLIASCFIFYKVKTKQRTTMPTSHVYIESEEFTTWLEDNIGLNWAPTYIIIKNNRVIGSIKGGIPEKQFTSQLGTILASDFNMADLPEIEITNIDNQTTMANNTFGNGLIILEISWIGCPDCEYQDENFTYDVYMKYGTSVIYRYYINSSPNEVIAEYK